MLTRGDLHPKLQRAHVGFVQWVMRTASDQVVIPLTEPLLSSLLSVLEQAETPPELRQFLYVCIGLIAHRNPTLIQKRVDILRFLFDAATHENPNVKVSITECLSMVFPAVQNPSADVAQVLLFLIQQAVQTAPAVAVKFAFAFPFSMVEARGVCLQVLAQNGLSSDLRQSARYALDPYYFKMTTQISRNPLPPEFYNFPKFEDAVSGLVGLTGIDVVETMRYLRLLWLHDALGETFHFDDEGWRDRLDTSLEVDETVRDVCKPVLQTWIRERHPGLERYFQYLRHVMATGNDDQIGVSVSQLLELVTLGGKDISTALSADVSAIKDLVFSRNEALREKAARLIGLVGVDVTTAEPLIRGLLRLGEGSIDRQHGAILAVAAILARLTVQGNQSVVPLELQTKFASDLAQMIISPNTTMILLEASMQSLAQLCIFGADDVVESSLRDQAISRLQALSKISRHGNVQDRAVLTLGYISFALTSPEDDAAVTKILDALFNVHEQKQVELLFSAGQALSCVAARWESKAMTLFRDAEFENHLSPLPGVLERVLNSILDGVRSPKHPLRKVYLAFESPNSRPQAFGY
jgi:proteasome component ECM29